MNDKPLPTVLFSNSLEQLLLRLKENVLACPADPFYRIEIIVSDAHVKTVLQLELAKAKGIVFGVEVTTIAEIAQKASGASFLDLFVTAISTGVNSEAALAIAGDFAVQEWYGGLKDKEARATQKHTKIKPTPNETHVFAVSALCPKLTDLLFLRPKVAYYVLSPCMHFWSDICSDQEAKKLTRRLHSKHAHALQGYLYDRSRLLANNGTRAREFIAYLEEKLEDFQEEYVLKEWVTKDATYSQYIRDEVVSRTIASTPTLLDVIQNDLLLMGRNSDKKLAFTKDDTSIQIHKAPTLSREVEVLYQYIQQVMPTVSGRIVVYAPDIEVYKPYIQSLFTQNIEIIASRKKELLPHFLQLLDMPYKRLQPKKMYGLFQVEAFRKKCGMELDDLAILAAVLQKFEVAQGHLKDQVILSWITSFKQSIELTSSDAEVLGKCLATLDCLYSDIQRLEAKKIRPCLEWQKLFLQIFETYFDPTHDERDEFYTIKQALIAVCQNELIANVGAIDQEKALSIFKVALDEIDEQKSSPCTASIIFATLGDVRTLPRDAVCFLGMHEGSFPRSSGKLLRKFGFLHPAKPPHTVSAIDRHLVIEAILTTASMLYISYQSYGFRERKPLQPSGIVLDLLQTLDLACLVDSNVPSKVLVKDHHLESCQEGMSVRAPAVSARPLQSTLGESLIDVIYIHELSQVAKYPMRAYMQHGLGLYLGEYKAKVSSSEFEVLDPRSLGMAKKQAFVLSKDEASELGNQEYRFLPQALKFAACSLLEEDVALLNKNAKTLGITSNEPLQIELSLSCKKPEQLSARSWKVPALTLDIDGRQVALAGTITNVYPEGIAVFDKKSSDALFKIWPELLLVHVLAKDIPIQSNVLYLKDAKVEKVEISNAPLMLNEYVAYAINCRKMPSCVYPEWIEDLQAVDIPPASLTESSSYAFRDPYLELYLSRVSPEDFQVEWTRWRQQALQLFQSRFGS